MARASQGRVFDYQSVCHCSKTTTRCRGTPPWFDYQSVCHCSKTGRRCDHRACWFDYQSVCHCSKTIIRANAPTASLTTSQFVTAPKPDAEFQNEVWFDYQSVCHCSKTVHHGLRARALFDYQSVCHCSKTRRNANVPAGRFDYQSVCHCSKTLGRSQCLGRCLTTSQFVTAPKRFKGDLRGLGSLTTSQFVTAPKPLGQNPLCGRTDSRLAHSFMIEESPCQYTFFSRIRKPHRRERSQAAARSIPEKPPVDRTLGPHLAPKNSSN